MKKQLTHLLLLSILQLPAFAQTAHPAPTRSTAGAATIEQDALAVLGFLADDESVTTESSASAPAPASKPDLTQVSINWLQNEHQTSRRQFSLNTTAGALPHLTANPDYAKNMAYMNAEVLRYHKGIVPRSGTDGWLDINDPDPKHGWKREHIKAAFENFTPPPGTDIMVNIAYYPLWMDADRDKLLDPDKYEAFASLCAELVHILNIEQKRGVRYFEILNEFDIRYWRPQLKAGTPPKTAELAKIFLLCAKAMKKVDPTIKTGGPAAATGENNVFPQHREYIRLTLPQLDFFSFHGYATGTAGKSDAFIYDKTRWLGGLIKKHRALLDELSPARRIELHFNEHNISWSWRIDEPRMIDHKGAVYDALMLIALVKSGVDVGNAWNDQQRVYGKLDPDNGFALRPGAHIYHYFNNWLVGQSVAATSDQPRAIVPFAVRSADGSLAFVLINRSDAANTVRLSHTGSGFPAAIPAIETARIARPGSDCLETATLDAAALREPFTLPPHSVTFYRFPTEKPSTKSK